MKQLKKTLLTLVALLALTTQAWATDVYLVGNGTGNWLNGIAWDPGAANNKMTEQNGVYSITFTNVAANSELQFKFALNGTWDVNYGCISTTEIKLNKTLSNIDTSGGNNILFRLTETADVTISFNLSELTYMISTKGMKVGDDASSGPEVAWDKTAKTGTFTMPGGNVTLEPEYYPQAELTAAPTAIDDVPATTDGAIVNAGTVANIGETTNAQGTVMYYVSQTALDDAALQALAADQWTADVPTAESLAQGQAYVYYYVRGNDSDTDDENFSDGDILAANALTVTIAAEPLWNAEFDLTNAPEEDKAGKWSTDIPEGGVLKGTEVKVTYTGTKKVIGFKAVKKAAAPAYTLLSAATAADQGKVVCADGHLHTAKEAVPSGCTAVGILGKVTETGHGLILALQDATAQSGYTISDWTSVDTYAGTTLKVLPDADARGTNLTSYTTLGSTAVSDWAMAQKSDYEQIFDNLGSTTGDENGHTYDGNVNAYITTGIGGTAMSGTYWSATVNINTGNLRSFSNDNWDDSGLYNFFNVRPVLGF